MVWHYPCLRRCCLSSGARTTVQFERALSTLGSVCAYPLEVHTLPDLVP